MCGGLLVKRGVLTVTFWGAENMPTFQTLFF
jgi:hypothetical protein